MNKIDKENGKCLMNLDKQNQLTEWTFLTPRYLLKLTTKGFEKCHSQHNNTIEEMPMRNITQFKYQKKWKSDKSICDISNGYQHHLWKSCRICQQAYFRVNNFTIEDYVQLNM